MDREKVIKALEHCKDNQHVNDCNKCDYGGKTGMFCIRMIDDAIALLKEQEPRILKPEEFAGTYSYCWLETKVSDGRTVCVISDICVADDGVNYEARFVGTSDRGKLPHDLLGSRWRCWSSEPTKQQREAVKWE